MKNDLTSLLSSLQKMQEQNVVAQDMLEGKLRSQNSSRRWAADRYLAQKVPDLSRTTLAAIAEEVPQFHLPMVSAWFGLTKKLDPQVSVDNLRMQLGAHLDNAWPVPKSWLDAVGRFDAAIERLQQNISELGSQADEIDRRIAAVQKLQTADFSKMHPETQAQLQQAVHGASKSTAARKSSLKPLGKIAASKSYPSQVQASSDSGPSMLEMWLWYQLLTSDGDASREISAACETPFTGGGGTFGGGGADGSFSSGAGSAGAETEQSVTPESFASSVAVAASVADSIETHYEQGAAQFS